MSRSSLGQIRGDGVLLKGPNMLSSTNKSKARVAVVGVGYWGKNLVRNFHELGALAALCDADRALEAGKDIIVEKPLAVDVKHGEELVKLAEEKHRILMVGHILRYHPAILKLQKLIQDGTLGKINYLYSNRLNIGKIRTEENILWSFAPHDISVMLSLLNEMPTRVTCQGNAYLNHGIPDVTLSHFEFPSGVQAHIFVSWLHPIKEQRLVVVGSEKM